ncbi:MAG: hypothetical protein ABIL09_07150 [Gemmatimonadota bacterium]
MTSRERLLAAMDCQETDHLPLYCLWSHGRNPYNRRDQLQRIPATLALGFDDTLWLHGPWRVHPDVRESTWTEPAPGADYQLLHHRWQTPAGDLEWVVRSSEYLTSPDQVLLEGAYVALSDAAAALPRRGFMLSPVDRIEAWTPWQNVEALLARWRELA